MLKRVVEDRFGFVRIRGELSGVKRAASGHLYCSLKDDKAVIDGVMWKGTAQQLAFRPEDGVEVVASGKLTTYPGRSKYQIVIESMEIAGEGALLALLERTRARLAAEGLFAAERKRPLPYLPKVIGVVTSPTGAVIRDILHRLADRFPSHVLVWPVLVQGEGAAAQVAAAVDGFSAIPENGPVPRPDLVIVARGGGSIEDLWAFNDEIVVRAIAASSIPVISAVGHETDTTLADFAADMRAPTPTAAAEMAVPVREELHNQLAELGIRSRRNVARPVATGRERLEARAQRLPRPDALLAPATQRLDDLAERLRRGLKDRAGIERDKLAGLARHLSVPMLRQHHAGAVRDLSHAGDRLGAGLRAAATRGQARLDQAGALLRPQLLAGHLREDKRRLADAGFTSLLLQRRIAADGERLSALSRLLPQLDPDKPLDRGFARVTDPEGQTLTSRKLASQEKALVLHFRDGKLDVAVGSGAAPSRKSRSDANQSRQGDLF